MQPQGYKAYANAQQTAVGPRELERMALAHSIHELTSIRENYKPGRQGYALYADALKFNQKLWTLIQSNIADSPTSGTAELRANFLELSLFVDSHTLTALRDPNPESLTPLIEINKKISSGLYPLPAARQREHTVASQAPMPFSFTD